MTARSSAKVSETTDRSNLTRLHHLLAVTLTIVQKMTGIKISMAAAASTAVLVLAGCSASTNAVAVDDATIVVSQDGKSQPGPNPKVNVPFFISGGKFDPGKTVTVNFYAGMNAKGKKIFTTSTQSDKNGGFNLQVNYNFAFGQYTVSANAGGENPNANFQAITPNGGLTKITSTKTGTTQMMSPVMNANTLYIAQSKSGGQIFNWDPKTLPTKPTNAVVNIEPSGQWQPNMPANVKMEQIAFTNNSKQLLISKKAMNINTAGGNSVWAYNYGATDAGTQLAGITDPKTGDGYYLWGPNPTAEKIAAYNKAHYPVTQKAGATPTAGSLAAIGNGGGVLQAAGNNKGYYYYGSLQSGCVYKQAADGSFADVVYCIPSLGFNNQNQSIYALDEDNAGNVYAVYQGSTDGKGSTVDNTIILKIKPSKSNAPDTVQALQVPGWARTTGIAVTNNGNTIWINGTSNEQYNTYNTNSILELTDLEWGMPPTFDNPAGKLPQIQPNDVVTLDPSTNPWLNGMTFDDKGDVLYIADNNGGFWMFFK